MSTIAAIQTQAELLIRGSAPPNDHFLNPKPLPRMPFEMKYEERRHLSNDPRVQKQIADELQFDNTIVSTIWSEKVAKYAPTLQERWMTAVDLERLMLAQGVTNPRLRGKVSDVLDTSSIVFSSSSTSSNYQNTQQVLMLKKGMNINNFMSSIFGGNISNSNSNHQDLSNNNNNNNNNDHNNYNNNSTTNSRPTTTQGGGGMNNNNNNNDDDNTTNYGKLSSSVPSFVSNSIISDNNNNNNNNNSKNPHQNNFIHMTNLRNEMRWNGIVVCKQILLLLTDPSRQDDFIGFCFDRFDRTDPAKRLISKNALLNTRLQAPDDDEAPPETFRWFETVAPPESAKKFQKTPTQNPKMLKEMQKILDAKQKKMEEESTFVLPDIPTGKKKKKKGKRKSSKDEEELPVRMVSGATYHQLEPLKLMIQANEIGNQFYPHVTYEDFKEAFLQPKNCEWVASFLGVIFEAMASYCTPVNDFVASLARQQQQQQQNQMMSSSIGKNNNNNLFGASNSRLFSGMPSNTTTTAFQNNLLASSQTANNNANPSSSSARGNNINNFGFSLFSNSSTTTATNNNNLSIASTSYLSRIDPNSLFSSRGAPLPTLPWITKTLQTVPSAPLMSDADVLLLLQLEKAGGSATDPVERKKRRSGSLGASSSSTSGQSMKGKLKVVSLRDSARNKVSSNRAREGLFDASSSAASEFLSNLGGGGGGGGSRKNTNNVITEPLIGSSTRGSNPSDFFITSTNPSTNNNNNNNNNNNTVPTGTNLLDDNNNNHNASGVEDDDQSKKRPARVKFV